MSVLNLKKISLFILCLVITGSQYITLVGAEEACYSNDDCPMIDIGNEDLDLVEIYCCRTEGSGGVCCDEHEYSVWESGKVVETWIETYLGWFIVIIVASIALLVTVLLCFCCCCPGCCMYSRRKRKEAENAERERIREHELALARANPTIVVVDDSGSASPPPYSLTETKKTDGGSGGNSAAASSSSAAYISPLTLDNDINVYQNSAQYQEKPTTTKEKV